MLILWACSSPPGDKKNGTNDLQLQTAFNGIKTLKDNLLISERKMQIKSNWNFAVRRCRLHKVYIHCKQRKQSFGENQLKHGEDRKVVLYLSLRLLNLLATNVMKKLKPWIKSRLDKL